MSVLVIGAGELGTAVIDALVNHPRRSGGRIGVVLRAESIKSTDPAKKQSIEHLRSQGIEIESGDFANAPRELIPTFQKYDVVVQAAGMGQKPGTQLGVAKAVLEAGVRRFFPWQYGLDYDAIGEGSAQDLFDEQLEVRKLLRSQSKTKWTIVSTGLFMSFWFLKDFGVVDLEKHTVRALGSWDIRVATTAAEDIGTLVAEAVYVSGEKGVDGVVYTAGDVLSYGEFADRMDAGLDTKFKREEWSIPQLEEKLEQDPTNTMTKYQLVFGRGKGTSWDIDQTLNHQRGLRLTTVADYIQKKKGDLVI
ncbi:uncharacterized protein E0L32_009339 [Thyridium curvatum]|uniref:NmrA-like domain-containing protein n=1 Tax=Thyridium curvatum TaxID=1093900 RepID=A0A507AX02_9PEZI|nr:uncharacterized protein E0L32_009339 [Thyridium curvatum]TPX09451.1 hypothetical protein E0L32_009339 [Thyridium curvatum]